MKEYAASRLIAKRIERAVRRSEARKRRPHKPTAAELARRYEMEVLKTYKPKRARQSP